MESIQDDPWRWIGGVAAFIAMTIIAVILSTGMGSVQKANAAPAALRITPRAERPLTKVRVVVGSDAELKPALMRAGVDATTAVGIIESVAQVTPVHTLPVGTPVDVDLRAQAAVGAPPVFESLAFRPRLDTVVHLDDVKGRLVPSTSPIHVVHSSLRIYGKVEVELRDSMKEAGIPEADVEAYVRTIGSKVYTGTIGPDDHFDVVMQQDVAADGQRRLGGIIYAGLYRTDGFNLRMSQWTQNGRLSWYDADEVGESHVGAQRPVPGVVSSDYGYRMHPILGYTRMHKGIDFRAGYGTPILAVQTGWVKTAGWMGSFGNQVELVHGGGLSTTYSHMSGVIAQRGQLVQQGQVIGYVGATGLATGPHLHMELHLNGQAIDPSTVQFTAHTQLAGNDLDGFRRRLGAILALPIGRSPEKHWLS